MTAARYQPALHRLALLTAAATFPLIFMGGLVTSHGAGMSVPDWPNSYGYNMFTFPPSKWVGGIFYEHTHRLMGTVVGMLSIALAVAAWRLERRRWARWLAISVLPSVIVQGVLGGLRVTEVNVALAMVHACFAQAFFCLTALVVIVTSRWWLLAPDVSASPEAKAGRRLMKLAVSAGILIYMQLIVGAMMRHEKAGLAIPDLPLAYGQLLPPATGEGLAAINQERAWTHELEPVTLWQVWLHFGHRVGALMVSVLVFALVLRIITRFPREWSLVIPAIALGVLLLNQLTLGVFTVLLRKPADITSLHVAVGALVLVTTLLVAVRLTRLYSLAFRDEPATQSRVGTDRAPRGTMPDRDPASDREDRRPGQRAAPATASAARVQMNC